MTLQNDDPLVTERVATGLRGPLVVALVAVLVVGALVWKPWDRPSAVAPGPTPVSFRPRPTPAVTATPVPTAVAPSPTPTATPMPTPEPGYHIAMRTLLLWGATVRCNYEPDADGMAYVLSSMTVGDTFLHAVLGTPELEISRVTWRAIIQVNRLETLFSANWKTVGKSPLQTAFPLVGKEAVFPQAVIPYTNQPMGMTTVARVVIRMRWFGPDQRLLGSEEAVAPNYSAGGSHLAEGCHVFTELPA